jgi:hypothetical protein
MNTRSYPRRRLIRHAAAAAGMTAAPLAALFAVLLAAPSSAAAQDAGDDWCSGRDVGRNQYCEVRQLRYTATAGELLIDVGPNGGIQVTGYDGTEVRVTARLLARAGSESAARDLARRVEINAAGREIRATGPRSMLGQTGWSVSVRVQVPHGTPIHARTTNGSITVDGTHAAARVQTTNGGIRLTDVTERVDARSTNGTIRAAISPAASSIEGVLLRTTNGGIHLTLPDRISARLELSTTNGSMTTDMPITVQGRMTRRQLSAVLGAGGPEIRASTTNGAIRISSH